MSTWLSETRNDAIDDQNESMGSIITINVDVVTDSDGQFSFDPSTVDDDLKPISVTSTLVQDAITGAFDIVDLSLSRAFITTSNLIWGVVSVADSAVFALGVLFEPVKRKGAGITVRLKIDCIKDG